MHEHVLIYLDFFCSPPSGELIRTGLIKFGAFLLYSVLPLERGIDGYCIIVCHLFGLIYKYWIQSDPVNFFDSVVMRFLPV
jgi:hypothetical protein